MDSIGGFEPLDLGSIPSSRAKININAHKGDSQERQVMTGSSDSNIEPYTVENRKTESYSIGWFDTRIKRGKVDPAPVYQRSYIREGDEKFRVRLVESVLCECPIPSLYLCETGDANYDVLDGQQRIRTLISFMNNDFPIRKKHLDPAKWNDGSLTAVHNMKFQDLPEELQNRFEDYQLKCDIFTESEEWRARDIYTRINAETKNLKPMELFKATYAECDNWETLTTYAATDDWLGLTGRRNDKRLEATELLVYHLVFADPAWNGLYPSEDLGRNKSRQIANKLAMIMDDDYDMEESLKRVSRWSRTVRDIYGSKPFAMHSMKLAMGSLGGRQTKPLVATFFTLFSSVIPQLIETYGGKEIRQAATTIREHFVYFVNDDVSMIAGRTRYFHYVEGRQQTLDKQVLRASTYLVALNEIMIPYATTLDPERCFDHATKVALFDEDDTCSFCNNPIAHLDDAVVDHHIAWVDGGATERSNARIAHRYCNWDAGQALARERNRKRVRLTEVSQ